MDLGQGEKSSLKGAFGDKPDYGLRSSSYDGRSALGLEDDKGQDINLEREEEGKFQKSEIERSGARNITLSWSDITTTVKIPGKRKCFGESTPSTTKTILEHVDGVLTPGNILAVMGPRGSGKSTLLNVLTSRNVEDFTVTGEILVNGVPAQGKMKNMSAYVQQDDLFINLLTVREQLQFRALLGIDEKYNREQRLKRVEEVIREVGLTNCANSRIGSATGSEKGISGGERKRLSVACEVLTNPPIFFCDEPTSGLDSFMAYEIIKTLQKMARKGRVVLCTIHQPSSEVFAMFSQILLLSEGKTAYMGPISKAMDFFASQGFPCPDNFNPADHFIITLSIAPGHEVETRKRSDAICDAFKRSEALKSQRMHHESLGKRPSVVEIDTIMATKNTETRYQSSFAMQLSQLNWRAWITQIRDPMYTWMKLARIVVVGLIFGLSYLQLDVDQKGVQDINGVIFIILVNTALANQYAVLATFPDELSVVMRDYGSAVYGISSYFLTKSFAELLMCIIDTLLFTTLNYWMIGLQDTFEAFAFTCAAMVIFAWVSIAVGYSIAIICGRTPIALAVNTPVLVTLMLFGGFFLNDSSVPDYMIWIKHISMYKYGYQILMAYQWKDVDDIDCDLSGNITAARMRRACPFKSGKDVLNYQNIDEDDILKNFTILGAIFQASFLLAFVALVIRGRRAKN